MITEPLIQTAAGNLPCVGYVSASVVSPLLGLELAARAHRIASHRAQSFSVNSMKCKREWHHANPPPVN